MKGYEPRPLWVLEWCEWVVKLPMAIAQTLPQEEGEGIKLKTTRLVMMRANESHTEARVDHPA